VALFVQRSSNQLPVRQTEGAAVRFKRNGTLLFALNSEVGIVATFFTKLVTECWIEADGCRLLPPEVTGGPQGEVRRSEVPATLRMFPHGLHTSPVLAGCEKRGGGEMKLDCGAARIRS
jgi:hypothetical protein